MCGRFQLNIEKAILEAEYNALFEETPNFPKYNVAPTSLLPIILNEDERTFQIVKWGIKPSWMKVGASNSGIINVRAETIAEKPVFKKSFEERRCLIPATGYYEWKKTDDGKKIPYYIGLKDGGLFSLAGIWTTKKNDKNEIDKEFAVITTTPNKLTKSIHDRMPVILHKKDENKWLMGEDINTVGSLMKSYPAEEMTMHQISTLINNPKNDKKEACMEV